MSLMHLPSAEVNYMDHFAFKKKILDVTNMHSFMLKQIFSDDICGFNVAVL